MCADRPRFCFPCLMNQTQGPIYRRQSVSTPLGFCAKKRLYRHRGRGAALFDVFKGASQSQRCGGDCDAGGACSDLLWHVWRSAPFVLCLSLCDYSHYLSCFWLSQAHVGLPAAQIGGFSCDVRCICWSAAIFVAEKQKRRVMSDVIYFLLASTAGAATHGHKPKRRGL